MHLTCRKALQYFRSIENQVKAMDSARTFNAFDLYNIQTMKKRSTYGYNATEPGVYRVEAYIRYKGRRRGWIFSNPIYIR